MRCRPAVPRVPRGCRKPSRVSSAHSDYYLQKGRSLTRVLDVAGLGYQCGKEGPKLSTNLKSESYFTFWKRRRCMRKTKKFLEGMSEKIIQGIQSAQSDLHKEKSQKNRTRSKSDN
ncbi:uncharacterized protein LOC135351790 [Halichondria panicea]|uniref:uncharacterized protein LOC135351790 n=1 Tax=Halichondria panicea TaxID=6063 RepID=UPI00312B9100